MKIAAMTLGCKLNQYETSCIINDFILQGWQKVSFGNKADVYLINSCTVTNRTDFKSRNAVRKALRFKAADPKVKIIVTGCYAQRNPEVFQEMGEIDHIIDNNSKNKIYAAISGVKEPEFKDIGKETEYAEHSTSKMLDRSRAFLKIQDGCDFFCAYCAVAWARGPSRSREKEKVLEQVKMLTSNGYREFVLAGVNLGMYGKDKTDNYYLTDLVQEISFIPGVEMIRLSSLEPQLFDNSLLDQIRNNQKICSHFHIPLQTGSDALLKSMGRRYTKGEFKELIEQLLLIRPDAALGFDVICGLPGESEQLFNETYDFLQSLPLAYLHVFPYSRRPGTRAWSMPGQVNGRLIRKRVELLLQLSDQKKQAYIEYILKGENMLKGIVEKNRKGEFSFLSDHYLRAYLPGIHYSSGSIISGRAVRTCQHGVMLKAL